MPGAIEKKRRPYTVTESAAVWKYIISNGLEKQIHKRSVWQAMEAARVTTHSAESMRSHYRQMLRNQLSSKVADGLGQRPFRTRRSNYTDREDQAILDYIIKNECYEETKSRSFWHRMERQRVTRHPAESMRNRFRRRLIDRLLEQMRSVLSVTQYDNLISSLFGTKLRTRSVGGESLPEWTEDFTISEATVEINDTLRSTSSLNMELGTKDVEPSGNPCGLSSVSIAHSTPCKRLSSPCEIVVQNGANSRNRSVCTPSSPRVSTQLDPRAETATTTCSNPSNAIPSFAREILQSSDRITKDIEVYVLLRMTNGSVNEAKNFLQTGCRRPDLPSGQSPPLWTLEADTQLSSCNLDVLRELLERFGADEVCRRIAFLSGF